MWLSLFIIAAAISASLCIAARILEAESADES
jgi:hypothetical protein